MNLSEQVCSTVPTSFEVHDLVLKPIRESQRTLLEAATSGRLACRLFRIFCTGRPKHIIFELVAPCLLNQEE